MALNNKDKEQLKLEYHTYLTRLTTATRILHLFNKNNNKYNKTWPEITDIINILIRCEFPYQVEFGFICEY